MATVLAASVLLFSLPLLAASRVGCPAFGLAVARPRPPVSALTSITMVAGKVEEVSEDEIDELVRREVEACFAGLETALANGDEKAALSLIESQGKQVMGNVLAQLEDDGQLLSSSLSKRIEELAKDEKVELLKRYDEQLAGLQQDMAADRQTIRAEMEQLQRLNDEYKSLQKGGGISLNRDKIAGGLAFVVGLTAAGSAANEGLKMAFGVGGEPLTVVLNLGLGAAGIGYYFVRTSKGKAQ